ncbi:unnamed protein product [Cyprideis torosa]|uniref:S-formylglutathione hydrolase n=1 Tax=Cyprideis torosa TaxID=163714 RepID=A0A7R8WCV9_9CRUS|nr:unnamed protein product [Cyprideis torosa]CAG0887745.1 unnamed protein product [Cyprideis torosa]
MVNSPPPVLSDLKEISANKCFGGVQKIYSHASVELRCTMKFALYLPPVAMEGDKKVPLVYWLSGLTCTEENFTFKSGFQRVASELGIAVLCPDTSPRGVSIPGQDDSYDFGSGAGFYVDATMTPWSKHYRMYSYVTKELPCLVKGAFPTIDSSRVSIMGHSMGGHGAIVCALKNPGHYVSVSAFSPITHPTKCPWGEKAFKGYLGSVDAGASYDATNLAYTYKGPKLDILVDQGTEDNFLKEGQLLPQDLVEAAETNASHVNLQYREQSGYDHSYYFIATFIEDHLRFHSTRLAAASQEA